MQCLIVNEFNIDEFVDILKSITGEYLFNPYTDSCIHDAKGGSDLREKNLRKYLEVIEKSDTIVIGEAPGYLGCRRTGIPFTDNDHLDKVAKIYKISRLSKATKSGKDKENSALYMWRTIQELSDPPFVWNIIPLHPYDSDNQLTNRTPNKMDYLNTKNAISYLLEHGNFERIIAVGRVAEMHLINMGYKCFYVRHPSHGGSSIFREQIQNLFDKPASMQTT